MNGNDRNTDKQQKNKKNEKQKEKLIKNEKSNHGPESQ